MTELDLKWAIKQFEPSEKRRRYNVWHNYYEGNHPLAFATEKFKTVFYDIFKEFSENMCPAVVDALNDRLRITGFRSSMAEVTTEATPVTMPQTPNPQVGTPQRQKVLIKDPQGERAYNLWKENRMDLRSTDVHLEALLMGDAYVLVWPDNDMRPVIWPQLATEMAVEYDANNLGVLRRAVKVWWDNMLNRWRLNVYLPDVIDKYQGPENSMDFPHEQPARWEQIGAVANPYGVVPVFHFANQREFKPGVSELKDVIPIQDGLNKSVVDMMVAMEFASYKQRYVIGYEPELDPETGEPNDATTRNYGVDRLMGIPDPESKVGQFDATDLGQFLEVQDKFWLSCARVTGTPLHYFYITSGDFPSGEAIKSAEGRFIKRIVDRQTAFGNIWENVMLFCMQIDGVTPADLTLSTQWENATPRSESELADTAVKKRTVGFPRSAILRDMGVPEEDIERYLEEADAEMIQKVATTAAFEQPRPQPGGESRDTSRARQGVEGG